MIERVLAEFQRIEGVKASILLSESGKEIASLTYDDSLVEPFKNFTLPLLNSARRLCESLGEDLESIQIRTDMGQIVIFKVDGFLLIIVSEQVVNLGLINLQLKQGIEKFREAI
ncbi:hypothetical protein DRP07_01645 [Archaeoglobales archaeon]|nr:MAG: hypothetical protein DRP07_01645 [Archaeoglobales archaeon]